MLGNLVFDKSDKTLRECVRDRNYVNAFNGLLKDDGERNLLYIWT